MTTTLTIADQAITLRDVPVFEAMELHLQCEYTATTAIRRFMVALFVQWKAGCGRPVLEAPPTQVGECGQQMLQALIDRGASYQQIETAGLAAWKMLRQRAGVDVSVDEVEGSADFSEAPDGSSPE